MPETQTYNPEVEASKEQIEESLNTAITEGNRFEAARLAGELKGIQPIVFPEGSKPRIFTTQRNTYGSPFDEYSVGNGAYLEGERRSLTEGVAGAAKTLLGNANFNMSEEGLDRLRSTSDGRKIADAANDQEAAANIWKADRAAREVGMYRLTENGSVSLRTPDGHLLSFALPTSIDRELEIITALEAAGYRDGEELGVEFPGIIGNNHTQNESYFKEYQRPGHEVMTNGLKTWVA